MQSNSRSELSTPVGNLSGLRHPVIPNITGSSQPIPQVGNLSRRRHDILSDTVGSSQSTPQVGNLNGRRCEVGRVNRGTRSGTRQDECGSSNSTLPNSQLSSRNSSPPPIGSIRERRSKPPRQSTIQTTDNTKPEKEPDGQRHICYRGGNSLRTSEYIRHDRW